MKRVVTTHYFDIKSFIGIMIGLGVVITIAVTIYYKILL